MLNSQPVYISTRLGLVAVFVAACAALGTVCGCCSRYCCRSAAKAQRSITPVSFVDHAHPALGIVPTAPEHPDAAPRGSADSMVRLAQQRQAAFAARRHGSGAGVTAPVEPAAAAAAAGVESQVGQLGSSNPLDSVVHRRGLLPRLQAQAHEHMSPSAPALQPVRPARSTLRRRTPNPRRLRVARHRQNSSAVLDGGGASTPTERLFASPASTTGGAAGGGPRTPLGSVRAAVSRAMSAARVRSIALATAMGALDSPTAGEGMGGGGSMLGSAPRTGRRQQQYSGVNLSQLSACTAAGVNASLRSVQEGVGAHDISASVAGWNRSNSSRRQAGGGGGGGGGQRLYTAATPRHHLPYQTPQKMATPVTPSTTPSRLAGAGLKTPLLETDDDDGGGSAVQTPETGVSGAGHRSTATFATPDMPV